MDGFHVGGRRGSQAGGAGRFRNASTPCIYGKAANQFAILHANFGKSNRGCQCVPSAPTHRKSINGGIAFSGTICRMRNWGRAARYGQFFHEGSDPASGGECALRAGRAVRRGGGEGWPRDRQRREPGHFRERSHGACGSERHPRSLPGAGRVSTDRAARFTPVASPARCASARSIGRGRTASITRPRARDAAEAGFDDSFIYEELRAPHGERKIPFEQDDARSRPRAVPGMGAEERPHPLLNN